MRTKGARCACACSTRRTNAAYALSDAARSAKSSNGAPAFAVPLRTLMPAASATGSGSPLSVLVSITASERASAVDGNDLAGSHHHGVAGVHAVDGNPLDPVAHSQPGELRGTLRERGEL